MSSQTPSPYGDSPYGSPGQNPYGAPPNPYSATGPAPVGELASWGQRVGGYLIDGILGALAGLPWVVGLVIFLGSGKTTTDPTTGMTTTSFHGGALVVLLFFLGGLTSLLFTIWNTYVKQGTTGYTIGKGVMGIRLLGEQTGQPVGAGMAFVRSLVHVLDTLACYVGWLWPIWDGKRQTFADKIMKTVVVRQPKP